MKFNIQSALSAIAICVSIVAVYYSAEVAKQISSSDHYAVEQVKSNTARLYVSLMSIAEKWALDSQGDRYQFDVSGERKVLSDFVSSESAIAYRAWIDENDAELDSKWRIFFPMLAHLSGPELLEMPFHYIVDILVLLESLTPTDVDNIVEYNSDLVEVVSSGLTKNNTIIQAMINIRKGVAKGDDPTTENEETRRLVELFTWLKESGVNDPNINLWLGILNADIGLIEQARRNGAVLDVLPFEVIDQYRDRLEKAGLL